MSASIHETALVETDELGAGTAVRALARIAPGATVGSGCTIEEQAFVGDETKIGDDVRVGVGARLLGAATVRRGASIGANATVLPGLTVGRGAVVGPGSVVESDVPAHAVVRGNPARIVSYVDALPETTEPELELSDLDEPRRTGVAGVTLYPLAYARDLRGSLSALEFATLPFVPQRAFAVYGVPDESVRGAHAHRKCGQLLVCMSGEVRCIADDGAARQEFWLQTSKVGIFLPPMVWGMQYGYTRDACLVVFAELPYDPDDYIRDYEEFLQLVAGDQAG